MNDSTKYDEVFSDPSKKFIIAKSLREDIRRASRQLNILFPLTIVSGIPVYLPFFKNQT